MLIVILFIIIACGVSLYIYKNIKNLDTKTQLILIAILLTFGVISFIVLNKEKHVLIYDNYTVDKFSLSDDYTEVIDYASFLYKHTNREKQSMSIIEKNINNNTEKLLLIDENKDGYKGSIDFYFYDNLYRIDYISGHYTNVNESTSYIDLNNSNIIVNEQLNIENLMNNVEYKLIEIKTDKEHIIVYIVFDFEGSN